jgi:putative ABC transport system ATP-binding protein
MNEPFPASPVAPEAPGASVTDPVIEVVDVVKDYDHGTIKALDGISLTVARGEFVAVTGRSGCGKSTLLHLVAALDRPTSGRIAVDGRDLDQRSSLDDYRRREIGLVFQLHNLLTHLDATENLEVAMMGTHRRRADKRWRALEMLDAVDLGARATMRPPRLSGGERQRLAIARALVNDPGIVLADEPTGSPDTRSIDSVLALFRRIRDERGTTVVLVTHDRTVSAAADRIIEMADGRIVDDARVPVAR